MDSTDTIDTLTRRFLDTGEVEVFHALRRACERAQTRSGVCREIERAVGEVIDIGDGGGVVTAQLLFVSAQAEDQLQSWPKEGALRANKCQGQWVIHGQVDVCRLVSILANTNPGDWLVFHIKYPSWSFSLDTCFDLRL